MDSGPRSWPGAPVFAATEDYGYIDFTVPRFAEFMRRYMPYRSTRSKRRPVS